MNFLLGRRIFSRYVSLKEGIYQEEILDKSLFRVHLFLRLWPKNYCTCEQRSWWRNMAKTIRLKPRWICRISFDPSNLSRSPGFSMKPSSFGNCKLISNYKAVLQVNLAWLNSLRERSQQVPRFAPFHTPTTPSQSAKIFFCWIPVVTTLVWRSFSSLGNGEPFMRMLFRLNKKDWWFTTIRGRLGSYSSNILLH